MLTTTSVFRGGIKGDGPPQTTLQKKKIKKSKNKCNLNIFGSYCGTVLQYSIRGSGGGSVENNNEMQTFRWSDVRVNSSDGRVV